MTRLSVLLNFQTRSYGMVTPDGLVLARLDMEKNEVVAKAVSYGSPQLSVPGFENASIVFRGNFAEK